MVGSTILHYHILEKLGEGGMGEVYKAQDTNLDRFVALKFLPSQVTVSKADKARFIQEAKAASAINHPNICTIYSIEEYNKQLFISMEFIDGKTLKNIAEKQLHADQAGRDVFLPTKQILDIGIQVAEGLAAAHEKGIVHRDIKPENIMVRKDGIAQIMDFGLAKLYNDGNVSRLTKAGSTVGTMGYMSPEQVQGLDVDHRTDIFSLGVVLYELLAGESPFKGMHETAIMYEIVNIEAPPLSTVKPEIDPELDRIILECLEKDKDERCQSAKELAKDLRKVKKSTGHRKSRVYSVNSQMVNGGSNVSINTKSGATSLKDIPFKNFFSSIFYNPKLAWTSSAILLIVLAYFLLFTTHSRNETEIQLTKATILPPHGIWPNNSEGSNLTISPDGKYISFVGQDSIGKERLWIRPISTLTARPLTDATHEAYPFWSPDSKSIAYFYKGKLMKISFNSGTPVAICDAIAGRGGSWNPNGTIVFAPTPKVGIYEVSAAGGTPKEIIKPDTSYSFQSLRLPFFLPDGNHFLYSSVNSYSSSTPTDAIFVSSLSDPKPKKLITVSSNCQYTGGYLFFVRNSTLLAQKFDIDNLKLAGEAYSIAENVQYFDIRISGTFAVSQNGKLIYMNQILNDQTTVLLNKTGDIIKNLFNQRPYGRAQFSPDGKKITYDIFDANENNSSIWIYELDRYVPSRLTFNKGQDEAPMWAKDGKHIIFSRADSSGMMDLYNKNSDGSGNAESIVKSNDIKRACDISADGRYILFELYNSGNQDIYLSDIKDNNKPKALISTYFDERDAVFSPDMKWIAYTTNESGKYQVYVISFNPGNSNSTASGKWQISIDGGRLPKWMNNGKSVYYFTPDNKIMSVNVNEKGSTMSPGKPSTILDLGNKQITGLFDINKTGNKIIAAISNGQNVSSDITLIENWQKEVEREK
jgi:serine/threonine protein kinase